MKPEDELASSVIMEKMGERGSFLRGKTELTSIGYPDILPVSHRNRLSRGAVCWMTGGAPED
jgi:hypothetical protein